MASTSTSRLETGLSVQATLPSFLCGWRTAVLVPDTFITKSKTSRTSVNPTNRPRLLLSNSCGGTFSSKFLKKLCLLNRKKNIFSIKIFNFLFQISFVQIWKTIVLFAWMFHGQRPTIHSKSPVHGLPVEERQGFI